MKQSTIVTLIDLHGKLLGKMAYVQAKTMSRLQECRLVKIGKRIYRMTMDEGLGTAVPKSKKPRRPKTGAAYAVIEEAVHE